MAAPDKRPLITFLRVEEAFDRRLLIILNQAAAEASKTINEAAASKRIGAQIRAEQQTAIRQNLMRQQAQLWKKIGSNVEAFRLEAAAAAIQANGIYESMLLRAVTNRERINVLLSAAEAQARATVDVAVARMQGMSYKPLSARVYDTQRLASGLVDRRINVLLAQGLSARDIAKKMREYIRPDVPGGVSYAAQRLGRTELNNAFHATQVKEAIDSPFIDYLQWKLSGSHKVPDQCNVYAENRGPEGTPAGTWDPNRVPSKPHPQCLCYTIPITPSREAFIKGYTSGKYDPYIDKLMREQGFSEEWIRAGKK